MVATMVARNERGYGAIWRGLRLLSRCHAAAFGFGCLENVFTSNLVYKEIL
jgi:hypothetical protein